MKSFLMKYKKYTFSESGFSLFELIVVISLIGILFVFVVPGFNNFFINSGLTGISKNIETKIKLLKHKSVKYQKTFFLNYNNDNKLIWISHEEMTKDEERDAIEAGIKIDDSIKFDFASSTNKPYVGFYKEGYSDQATIILYEDNIKISLIIKPLLINPEYIKT